MASSASSLSENHEEIFALKHLDPINYYASFIKQGVRPDAYSRGLADLQPVSVTVGTFSPSTPSATASHTAKSSSLSPFSSSSSCVGSSLVQWGDTKVACGVNIMIGTPSPMLPDHGDIEFNVCLWPISSPKYEQRRSKTDTAYLIESQLASLVNESDMINTRQLCIEAGKSAFRLCVSVVFLSDQGSLTDAAILAVVSALSDVKLPCPIINSTDSSSSSSSSSSSLTNATDRICVSMDTLTPLAISNRYISITCGIFKDTVLVDPSESELPLLRGWVTSVWDKKDNMGLLSQRVSDRGLTGDELGNVLEISRRKAQELRRKLDW